jgi:hypothetical protein
VTHDGRGGMAADSPSGELRNYLRGQNSGLATVAHALWLKSGEVHDRQNRPDSNENGRRHVEAVERNIWTLLTKTRDKETGRQRLEELAPPPLNCLRSHARRVAMTSTRRSRSRTQLGRQPHLHLAVQLVHAQVELHHGTDAPAPTTGLRPRAAGTSGACAKPALRLDTAACLGRLAGDVIADRVHGRRKWEMSSYTTPTRPRSETPGGGGHAL